jgi:hypothetical protein
MASANRQATAVTAELNNAARNWVSSSPYHVISVQHLPLLRWEVVAFSCLFSTYILNMCTHLIVIMTTTQNEGITGHKGVTKRNM